MEDVMENTLYAQIAGFAPRTLEEERAKAVLLQRIEQYGSAVLKRDCPEGHITCSGFIMSPDFCKTLMAYHLIYGSVGWTGGHADGEEDLLGVALREAAEETSAEQIFPYSREILSIDILPVPIHEKRGNPVAAHVHYNVTFGLIAPEGQKIADKPDENCNVMWLPVEDISRHCTEPWMLPIYEKLVQRMKEMETEKYSVLDKIQSPLLKWYPTVCRQLPWRRDIDPYHVWISEIMLQQTRVEAVKTAYLRFLERLPDIKSLSLCPEDTLLKLWEGLGYYSRARNLKRAAEKIMTEYNGSFPADPADIRQLPGIGDYTAGAVSSVCFGKPIPAVDGNVLRIVARLCELHENVLAPAFKRRVTERLTPVYEQAADRGMLTQSFMELGQSVCVPGEPRCMECPLSEICLAHKNGCAKMLPVRVKKTARREQRRTVFILWSHGKIALRKRPDKGLLASMWELPGAEGQMSLPELIAQVKSWGCQPEDLLSVVKRKHMFTHITWLLDGVYMTCRECGGDFVWASPQELETVYSLPTAFRCVLSEELLPQE